MILKGKEIDHEVFREQTFHRVVVIFTHFSLATQLSDLTCPITSIVQMNI